METQVLSIVLESLVGGLCGYLLAMYLRKGGLWNK